MSTKTNANPHRLNLRLTPEMRNFGKEKLKELCTFWQEADEGTTRVSPTGCRCYLHKRTMDSILDHMAPLRFLSKNSIENLVTQDGKVKDHDGARILLDPFISHIPTDTLEQRREELLSVIWSLHLYFDEVRARKWGDIDLERITTGVETVSLEGVQ
ncbi:hypothetical protein CPC08DRAFT_721115 [Agrocybe pediades]|nr:hypothetical protein CPC08DRAFT_721115 [Agrocybe pediades]